MNLIANECLAFEDIRIGLITAKKANIDIIVSESY